MRPSRMESVVERRLLVNYRLRPDAAARLLPAPLRPQEVGGWAVGGICMIRLGRLRPGWAPGPLGMRSENAAHRIAVEWDGPDGRRTGVYIPRRDSGSMVNALAGGRLFPGEHHRAAFEVREDGLDFHVAFTSADGTTHASVDARAADRLVGSALFAGLREASDFFRRGSVGLSATRGGRLDAVRLRSDAWRVEPAEVRAVRSSFFDDPRRFPPGGAVLDCALLMRDLPATWSALPPMTVGGRAEPSAVAP